MIPFCCSLFGLLFVLLLLRPADSHVYRLFVPGFQLLYAFRLRVRVWIREKMAVRAVIPVTFSVLYVDWLVFRTLILSLLIRSLILLRSVCVSRFRSYRSSYTFLDCSAVLPLIVPATVCTVTFSDSVAVD